jgi:hypothetical protein
MYGFLLSHTFPGSLVLIEILLCLEWFAGIDVWVSLKQVWSAGAGSTIFFLILGYALSTLLGNILDGTHHFFFEDFLRQQVKEEKFNAISDNLTMDIYKHFLEDDLWYPYEQYANISFAMIPGWGLLGYWLLAIMHFHGLCFWIPILCYGIILIITFAQAIYTYRRFLMDEKEFIAVYSSRKWRTPRSNEEC